MKSPKTVEQIIQIKRETRQRMIEHFSIKATRNQPVGLVCLDDEKVRDDIVEGLAAIGVIAVVVTDKEFSEEGVVSTQKEFLSYIAGFDFFIYDGESEEIDVLKFLEYGVVPIMPEGNGFKAFP